MVRYEKQVHFKESRTSYKRNKPLFVFVDGHSSEEHAHFNIGEVFSEPSVLL